MHYDDQQQAPSLQALKNKTNFLYQVWKYFLAYSLVGVFVNLLLLFLYSRVRNMSLDQNIDSSVVILAALALLLRVLSQLNKRIVRNFKPVLLSIDLLSYFFINIYCFLLLDGIGREEKNFYGHFVFIYNFVFFGITLAFLLSVYYSSNRKYDVLLGILITNSTLCFLLIMLVKLFPALPRESSTYYGIVAGIVPLNLYLCLNSYYLIQRRANQYVEEDDFCAFLNFSLDWTWSFQKDFFRSIFDLLTEKKKNKGRKEEKEKEIGTPLTVNDDLAK